MNTIGETLNNMFSPRTLREDEYRNEADGLIYCARCHTPRQTRITLNGAEMTPPVLCACRRAQQEQEEKRREQQDLFQRVSRLKAAGLQDRALRDYTFANDLGYNPEMEKAHRYVEHWEEMKAKSIGFLLWGDVGTGKSFFAGCIANALLEQGIPVLMTNVSRILNSLTGMFSEDRNRFIDSLNQYSLLILDDLGIERETGFALEQIFSVIDSRYRSKKPMIITTNLSLDELKHPSDLAHGRIYNRVLERCVPLKINNLDIRSKNAADNLKQARKLLQP